jgi:hypothetical protein
MEEFYISRAAGKVEKAGAGLFFVKNCVIMKPRCMD